jgi:hypothetical protein
MAKQRNINIVYKVNTAEVAAATKQVETAKKATDQLEQSTKKYETASSAAYKKTSISIQDLNVKLSFLRQQIVETDLKDGKRLDELIKKYKVLSADVQKYNSLLNDSTKQTNGLTDSLGGIVNFVRGGIMAALVKETAQALGNMAILAGKIEGVKIAFDKLPGSTKILNDMRVATRGMLTDYNLMQRALQAKNFKIPLEEFATLLDFATVRAQQTGQEVDYLVDSIVRGIGMQSVLRLDNLGISAARLRKQFEGVSIRSLEIADVTKGVTEVIREEMAEMGGYVKTSETSVGNLGRAWNELKNIFSTGTSGFTAAVSDFFADTLDYMTSLIKGSKAVNDEIAKIAGTTQAQSFAQEKANKNNLDAFDKELKLADQKAAKQKLQIMMIKEELKLNTGWDREKRDALNEQILVLQNRNVQTNEYIKVLSNLRKELVITMDEEANQILTYEDLNKELEDLNEQFETQTSRNDIAALKLTGDKIKKVKELIAELDKLRNTEEKKTKKGEALDPDAAMLEQFTIKNEIFLGQLEDFEKAWIKTEKDIEKEYTDWYDAELQKRLMADASYMAENFELQKRHKQAKKQVELEFIEFVISASHDILLASLLNRDVDTEDMNRRQQEQLDAAGNNERAKMKLEKQFAKEKEAAANRQKEIDKKNALIRIAVDTAANAVRALGIWPVPNFAMAGIALGYGLVQAATVRKFKDGVIGLDGPGNATSDSIPARLSRGESVMTAKETDSSKGLLEAIRAKKLDDDIFERLVVNSPAVNVDLAPLASALRGNKSPDLVKQGDFIYEMKSKGKNTKQLIRSKSFSM